jgi:hypothetical protein
MLMYNY